MESIRIKPELELSYLVVFNIVVFIRSLFLYFSSFLSSLSLCFFLLLLFLSSLCASLLSFPVSIFPSLCSLSLHSLFPFSLLCLSLFFSSLSLSLPSRSLSFCLSLFLYLSLTHNCETCYKGNKQLARGNQLLLPEVSLQ